LYQLTLFNINTSDEEVSTKINNLELNTYNLQLFDNKYRYIKNDVQYNIFFSLFNVRLNDKNMIDDIKILGGIFSMMLFNIKHKTGFRQKYKDIVQEMIHNNDNTQYNIIFKYERHENKIITVIGICKSNSDENSSFEFNMIKNKASVENLIITI
jgi:hypothetical protein